MNFVAVSVRNVFGSEREWVCLERTVEDVVVNVPSSVGEEVGCDGAGVCDGHSD